MLINYIQQALGLLEKADAVLICDKDGFIEYGKWYKGWYFTCAEVVGKSILEVYPTLTEETSTIMRCLKHGEGRIDDEQHIVNFKGEMIHVISTTLPITVEGKVVGAICASTFCDSGRKMPQPQKRQEERLCVLDDIVTQNHAMKELKIRISQIARNNATVLIYGETGTGKQLVAESIHTSGDRKDGPFISQNCAAVPSTLLESIFFGTEKGSYTGAESRKGLFELADGGTLFLDEINSMDIVMQAKILKVLEEKRVRRVGGMKDHSIDVKIICAMNEEPLEVLRSGKMREDLFFRISVVQLRILPLRERKEDIMLLTNHFISLFNREYGKHVKGLSELAVNAFEGNRWRGNVRELRNTLESAFMNVSGEIITIKCLPDIFFMQNQADDGKAEEDITRKQEFSLTETVNAYEKELIQRVVSRSKNMAEAAKRMRISRQTLKYKMEKYGIEE